MKKTATGSAPLPSPDIWPSEVRKLFWDSDAASINPLAHRAHVIQRILCSGGLAPLRWLRAVASDDELRRHIEGREGREIEPRRLRYFELIFGLPRGAVTAWIRRQRDLPAPGRREGTTCTRR